MSGPRGQRSTSMSEGGAIVQESHDVNRAAVGRTERTSQVRVLHVTTCVGGGVPVAIARVATGTDADHLVAWPGENAAKVGDTPVRTAAISTNPVAAAAEVATIVRRFQPDIVHAHSSIAGVIVRLLPTLGAGRIVYQPHCYKFDDPELSATARRVIRWTERRLAPRAGVVLALTAHEEALAQELSTAAPVRRVVNAPSVRGHRHVGGGRTVVMAGRIAPQKDPRYFADVARATAAIDPGIAFTWIGDGDADLKRVLTDAGVAVSGWLDRETTLSRVSGAGLYLHSASYEGFPLTVVEAASIGTPVVVRDLPCFDGSRLRTVGRAQEAATVVSTFFQQAQTRDDVHERTQALRDQMSARAMSETYGAVYRAGPGRRDGGAPFSGPGGDVR